ncbi:tripartite tricarboxylate transporter TctB family protein [Aureimonas sp. AU4]|uniref:tripartite tricarboxylate transporter TctB family protein n=1 Tax=Aureimonas sp. AU4 TaxID=1638163 RepID=UPI000AAEF2B0|nr:tripartite tricarboxylate transporter TctB family protein [Aureimonas sp. AU4]
MTDTSMPAPRRRGLDRNVVAGLIFIAIAAAFAWEATHYDMGRAIRMGPGFIPMTLAILLAIFGVLVLAAGLRSPDHAQSSGPVAWKGIALVCAALLVFGRFGAQLGLVPTVLVCTFAVAMASARNTLLSAAAIAAVMAALCWLVFKVGLGITMPTLGPLFGS